MPSFSRIQLVFSVFCSLKWSGVSWFLWEAMWEEQVRVGWLQNGKSLFSLCSTRWWTTPATQWINQAMFLKSSLFHLLLKTSEGCLKITFGSIFCAACVAQWLECRTGHLGVEGLSLAWALKFFCRNSDLSPIAYFLISFYQDIPYKFMNFWLFELLGLQMATWICSVASALIIGTLLLRNGIESNLGGRCNCCDRVHAFLWAPNSWAKESLLY